MRSMIEITSDSLRIRRSEERLIAAADYYRHWRHEEMKIRDKIATEDVTQDDFLDYISIVGEVCKSHNLLTVLTDELKRERRRAGGRELICLQGGLQ